MKTNLDINDRWESGIPHHPKSIEIGKLIGDIDYKLGGDAQYLQFGGDGDNGEALLYCLDIIFECQDNNETELLKKKLKGKKA